MSTRTYLLSLILAVIVPVMAFSTLLLGRYAVEERARYEREASLNAHNAALVVDGELAGLLSLLRGLASSSALARSDISGFQEEARRLVEGTEQIVILTDLARTQYLNTAIPFAIASLPAASPISTRERTELEAGNPVIGGVFPSTITDEPRIALSMPVSVQDREYILSLTVPTRRIFSALTAAVPEGWTVTVGDSAGTIVTRSERHEEFSGTPGLPEYLAKASGQAGTFVSSGFGGESFLAGYELSDFSGWLYAANVPVSQVEAPLWRSLGIAGAVGLIALAVSALTAFRFAGRLSAAVRGLEQRAVALGRAEPVEPLNTRLTEFSVVAKALRNAAAAVEERARETEKAREREALLGGIFEGAHLSVGICEIVGGDVVFVVANREAANLLGKSRVDGLSGRQIGLGEAETEFWCGIAKRLEGQGGPLTTEFGLSQGDGTRSWFVGTFTKLAPGAGGAPRFVFTAIDITERKRNEEQRRLLLNELNHRVKNTLATIQSIAVQTLNSSSSLKEARDALSSRLMSLAQTHDVLTRESWEGADLRELVKSAISPHSANKRISIDGPAVRLTPQMALLFALTLHELATNAAKYGALSSENGSVSVTWRLDGNNPVEQRLGLRWQEHGGPKVEEPTHRGFGTRLLTRMFANEKHGQVQMEYKPDGVVCRIEVMLPDEASEEKPHPSEPTTPPIAVVRNRTKVQRPL